MAINSVYSDMPIPKTLIHPDGKVKMAWNGVLVLILLYTAIIMPYRLAFIDHVWFDTWFWVELTVDALFLMDFLVNLNTAYFNIDGDLVVSRRRIFLMYLRGWMLLDLLAVIPFNLIESAANDS